MKYGHYFDTTHLQRRHCVNRLRRKTILLPREHSIIPTPGINPSRSPPLSPIHIGIRIGCTWKSELRNVDVSIEYHLSAGEESECTLHLFNALVHRKQLSNIITTDNQHLHC